MPFVVAACDSQAQGGGDSGGSAVCASYCSDVCEVLKGCPDANDADCEKRCNAGLSASYCSDQEAADRMTCGQSERLVACSSYCDALCKKGADCITLDEEACRLGCLLEPPSVCNPKSVAARSCEELKFELTCSENIGNDTGSCGGGEPFCTTTSDCAVYSSEPSLACDLETNLCAPCTSDEMCQGNEGELESGTAYVCNEDKRCEQVECLKSSDCSEFEPYCDVATHTCLPCGSDQDCADGAYKVCNLATHECVECGKNADCEYPFGMCDPSDGVCVGCLTDNDCTPSEQCDPDLKFCR